MENEKLPLSVPYIVHESAEARHERTVRRMLAEEAKEIRTLQAMYRES